MFHPILKTVSRLILVLAVVPAFLQGAYAQTVVESPAAVVAVVEECDDSQNEPVTVSPVAGATIVDRLGRAESGVTVEGPDALMRRALPGAAGSVTSAAGNVDEAAEEAETERAVRTKSGKTVGFRVQVYADNNARSAKVEARQRERAIGQQFPAYSTYVSYASPYWRLRVGDFPTQYDAEKAASEIRKAFPRYAREVRVVRDRINAH